jgi:hypothetical protein
MRMLPSSSLTDPDVQVSRFRFFMQEFRSRRCPERAQGWDFQHVGVVEVEYAFVSIFGEQGIEHGTGLCTVFCERIPFFHIFGTLSTSERFSVECDMADQVEGIEVLAYFVGAHIVAERVEYLDENGKQPAHCARPRLAR